MRVLELFSGTGSVGDYFRTTGHRVVSVDIDPAFSPVVCCDILRFPYTLYPPGYFHIVWASPECKIYSTMQHCNVGPNKKFETRERLEFVRRVDYKYTDRVLDIIRYFQPKKWFIEQPQGSQLRWHPELQKEKEILVDYCRFGKSYKKPTRIWSNVIKPNRKCVCIGEHDMVVANKAGRLGRKTLNHDLFTKYTIPRELIHWLTQD